MKKYTRPGESRGYRSTFETTVCQFLDLEGIKYKYEPDAIEYFHEPSTYTPDLKLENGIYIELKGYFDAADRKKHLLIKQQHPDLDIRFVFMKPKNKLNKNSATTYGDWCDQHGFKWAGGTIPLSWVKEKPKS